MAKSMLLGKFSVLYLNGYLVTLIVGSHLDCESFWRLTLHLSAYRRCFEICFELFNIEPKRQARTTEKLGRFDSKRLLSFFHVATYPSVGLRRQKKQEPIFQKKVFGHKFNSFVSGKFETRIYLNWTRSRQSHLFTPIPTFSENIHLLYKGKYNYAMADLLFDWFWLNQTSTKIFC